MQPDPARATPARFDASSQNRRSMIAKIQIARQQLAIDEDDYRQMLLTETGRLSLKDCSEPQMARVLDWMKRKGFKTLPQKGAAAHPMARKARAIWISLYHLGVVHNPAEAALEAFAKRQLGCEKLVWARQSDAYKLIEALKAMGTRAGWLQRNLCVNKPLSVKALQESLCHAILAKLRAAGVAPLDWSLDMAAFRLCGIETASEEPYSAEDYGRLAAALGKVLREHGAAGQEAQS
jgi:phage gp16-like protein